MNDARLASSLTGTTHSPSFSFTTLQNKDLTDCFTTRPSRVYSRRSHKTLWYVFYPQHRYRTAYTPRNLVKRIHACFQRSLDRSLITLITGEQWSESDLDYVESKHGGVGRGSRRAICASESSTVSNICERSLHLSHSSPKPTTSPP